MATILYSKNFDADTVGASLPEWISVSGTWVVSTTGSVSSPNAYRNTGMADGQVAVLGGTGAPAAFADGVETYSQIVQAGTSSAYALSCPLARSNAAATQNYLYLVTGTVGGTVSVQLLAKVPGVNSGNYVPKGTTQVLTGISFAAGDQVYIKHREIGTSFAFKIWKVGQAEPASFQGAWTDATIAAAGFYGRYQSTNGSTTVSTGFDDVTVTTATTDFAPNNGSILYSAPVVKSSSLAKGISSGRCFDVNIRESDVAVLLFDTSNTPAGDVQYRVDNGQIQRATIAASVNIAMPYSGAKGQTHRLRVWMNIYEGTSGNTTLWGASTGGWWIAGIRLADGGSLATPISKRKIEFWGDSITASVRRLYTGVETTQLQQIAMMSAADHWPELVADDLGMIPVTRGFGAVGMETTGNGGVPRTVMNVPYVFSGQTYTPDVQPDVLVIHLGTNLPSTQADYQEVITTARSMRPNARILLIAPPGKNLYATIQAAIASAAPIDTKISAYDIGAFLSALGGEDFTDMIGHVSSGGAQLMAQLISAYLQPLLEADRIPASNKVLTGTTYNYGTQGTAAQTVGGAASTKRRHAMIYNQPSSPLASVAVDGTTPVKLFASREGEGGWGCANNTGQAVYFLECRPGETVSAVTVRAAGRKVADGDVAEGGSRRGDVYALLASAGNATLYPQQYSQAV